MWRRLALVLLVLPASVGGASVGPRSEAERLARENERLHRRLELASADAFYLVLDPPAKRLRLMYHGAVLGDYPVLEAWIGQPRTLFVTRRPPEDWAERIWDRARLDPPRERDRIEIPIPEGNAAEAEDDDAFIPPTPEEAIPAPPRWRLRFADGLSIEVVGERAPAAAFGARLRDALAALWPGATARVRLRLVLPAEHAGMLYRALPDDTRFTIDSAGPDS